MSVAIPSSTALLCIAFGLMRQSRFIVLAISVLSITTLHAQQNQVRLWGVTSGSNDRPGYGGIYSVYSDGSDFQIHKTFQPNPDGSRPLGRILKLTDGSLMGMTSEGGVNDIGVIYKMNADGTGYNKVLDLTLETGFNPSGRLMLGTDGFVYGTTRSWLNGQSGTGTIFRINADGTNFTKLYHFAGDLEGIAPWAGLLEASDGRLYGTTIFGGSAASIGSVFGINKDGTGFQKLHAFEGLGGYPRADLIEGTDGFLYGMTSWATAEGGSLFKIGKDGTGFEHIHLFGTGNDGHDQGAILQLQDGSIVGIATFGGDNQGGVLFKINQDGTGYTILHHLTGTNWQASIGLTSTGKIYSIGQNTMFTINTDGTGVEIFPLGTFELHGTYADVLETEPGTFIGVGEQGGAGDNGGIFKVSGGEVTTLREFIQEGGDPESELLLASNGALYGKTTRGGTIGFGTLFKIEKDGSGFTHLYEFETKTNYNFNSQISPGGLLEIDGFLYGATREGIYKVDLDGDSFTYVKNFYEVQIPLADLRLGADGFLYGLKGQQADFTKGELFKVRPDGTDFAVVLDMTTSESLTGTHPSGLRVVNDDIYFVTTQGGANSAGTLSRVSLDGSTVAKVLDIEQGYQTAVTRDVPVLASNGRFYGKGIGENAYYSIKPDGSEFTAYPSNNTSGGFGSLIEPIEGKLYGTSWYRNIHVLDLATGTIETVYEGGPEFWPTAGLTAVEKVPQVVTLAEIAVKEFGGEPFTISATSSHSLPITYSISNEDVATIDGNTVTIAGVGVAVITAHQAGTIAVNPAMDETTLTVLKAIQGIALPPVPDKTLGDASFALDATATSGLPVAFTSTSDRIAINGNTVTIVKAGRPTIVASQEGDVHYEPAEPVQVHFCINPAKPVITLETGENPTLTSSNETGNVWLRGGTVITGAVGQAYAPTETGIYTVQTTIDNCSSAVSEPMNVLVTGLKEEMLTRLIVYPNPVVSDLLVELTAVDHANVVFEMFDALGRRVNKTDGSTNTLMRISMQEEGAGMYYLKAAAGKKVYTSRVVKK